MIARLVAVVWCPPKYTKVLKSVIPDNAIQKKYAMERLICCHSSFVCRMANGSNISAATAHRKKARLTGGILPTTPRAIIKLADHSITAAMAIRMAMRLFLLVCCIRDAKIRCFTRDKSGRRRQTSLRIENASDPEDEAQSGRRYRGVRVLYGA